nr:hypothetical protein [Tanacetum cinerariifolium]
QSNGNAGTKDNNNAGQARKEKEPSKITSCYHCGLLIHLFHKSQRVLKMLDLNLLMMLETRNKMDERGIVIRNKTRLVAQGHIQKEGIKYDEVFALVTKIEAITLFLAYASFKDFVVYQMDVKSSFFMERLKKRLKQKKEGIFISQDTYVAKILKKFGFYEVKTASTPMETQKPLLKDEDGEEVDVHIYRSMIGSLIYLTSSRPDIMFAVYAYARYQVNPKCKKQTMVLNSTTEVEYVVASNCCGQTLRYILAQGMVIDNIDQDVEITLVDDTQRRMNEEDLFGVNDLDGDEVVVDVSASEKVHQSVKFVEKEVSTTNLVTTAGEVVTTVGIEVTTAATTPQISKDELTLAQTLIEIKASKPKAIKTAATTVTAAGTRPMEKGIVMQEPSETPSPKPIDSSQQPLKLKTKEELSIEEKSRLFVELVDKRKKHFTRLRAEKIRSKPPTKAQKRNQMYNYLKNMENYKHNQLKNKSFKEIQMLFNNTMKWIEVFIPMDTELVKDSEKSTEGSEKATEEKTWKFCGVLSKKDLRRQSQLMIWTMYPFTRNILHQMWNDVRLQVDYEVEMAYDLLRLIRRQINEGYVPERSVWIHPPDEDKAFN